jgi:hypothetical protein
MPPWVTTDWSEWRADNRPPNTLDHLNTLRMVSLNVLNTFRPFAYAPARTLSDANSGADEWSYIRVRDRDRADRVNADGTVDVERHSGSDGSASGWGSAGQLGPGDGGHTRGDTSLRSSTSSSFNVAGGEGATVRGWGGGGGGRGAEGIARESWLVVPGETAAGGTTTVTAAVAAEDKYASMVSNAEPFMGGRHGSKQSRISPSIDVRRSYSVRSLFLLGRRT